VTEASEGLPGSTLQSAREALEISPNDVAESLNLPLDAITGIEAGDYEKLPGVTFTRGYIRAYAKLLDLDADALVAQFDATAGGADASVLVVSKPRRGIVDVSQGDPGRVLSIVVGVVLVAAVVILWFVWPETGEQSTPYAEADERLATPRPGAAAAVGETRQTSPEPIVAEAVEAEPSITEDERSEGAEQAALASGLSEAGDETTPSGNIRAAADAAPEGAAAPAAVSVAATGIQRAADSGRPNDARGVLGVGAPLPDHLLSFSFSDDCWVEVQDRSGRSIYSDLSRPGQSLELTGEAPFRILLGYAPGVHLEYNGEPVALAAHTRNNVAQLVLGQ